MEAHNDDSLVTSAVLVPEPRPYGTLHSTSILDERMCSGVHIYIRLSGVFA